MKRITLIRLVIPASSCFGFLSGAKKDDMKLGAFSMSLNVKDIYSDRSAFIGFITAALSGYRKTLSPI
jgi:hypothetical protein